MPNSDRRQNYLVNLLAVMLIGAVTMTVSYRWPQFFTLYVVVAFVGILSWAIIDRYRKHKPPSE